MSHFNTFYTYKVLKDWTPKRERKEQIVLLTCVDITEYGIHLSTHREKRFDNRKKSEKTR